MESIRKTALTAYGKVGTDWVRMTLARIDDAFVFVRADGSNAIVDTLPVAFRTSGDIANVTATLNHRVSMAAVPSVGLPNHTWKGTFDLAEIAEKFGVSQHLEELISSYNEAEQAAA